MKREILGQFSGQIIKTDTSFRVAGRTMTTSGVSGLCFALGEDGKIHRYGAVKSESEEQLYPLFQRCVSIFVALRFVIVQSHARQWRVYTWNARDVESDTNAPKSFFR